MKSFTLTLFLGTLSILTEFRLEAAPRASDMPPSAIADGIKDCKDLKPKDKCQECWDDDKAMRVCRGTCPTNEICVFGVTDKLPKGGCHCGKKTGSKNPGRGRPKTFSESMSDDACEDTTDETSSTLSQ